MKYNGVNKKKLLEQIYKFNCEKVEIVGAQLRNILFQSPKELFYFSFIQNKFNITRVGIIY